jgi:predicted metal-dependent RNase
VEHPSARDEIIQGEPSIIIATSGMLEGGPVIDYFKRLASDKRNTIVFISYQIDGTLGSRVQKGLTETSMVNTDGKVEIMKVELNVESIEGFSGHSDRKQITNYVHQVTPKPERIIVCHGERTKCSSLANILYRKYKVETMVPAVRETIRLR